MGNYWDHRPTFEEVDEVLDAWVASEEPAERERLARLVLVGWLMQKGQPLVIAVLATFAELHRRNMNADQMLAATYYAARVSVNAEKEAR